MTTTAYQPPTQLIRYSGLVNMTNHSTRLEDYITIPHKPVNANYTSFTVATYYFTVRLVTEYPLINFIGA